MSKPFTARHVDYPEPVWALDGETPVQVAVEGTHRPNQPASYRITGYTVVNDKGRRWFTHAIYTTEAEAALIAGELATALDL